MRDYLDDNAIDRLKRAGFTFIRLPLQSDMLTLPDALTDAVAHLQRHGLAVAIPLFAVGWDAETDPARLLSTWRSLALLLRRLNPSLTFPEVLNEPVFANEPGAWETLQHKALAAFRAVLPARKYRRTHRGRLGRRTRPTRTHAGNRYECRLQLPLL